MISLSEYKKITAKKATRRSPKKKVNDDLKSKKPKKAKKKSKPIDKPMEILLFHQFMNNNGIVFEKEVLMSKIINTSRGFIFDYYLPDLNTAIEINGGEWINGRHNSGTGYQTDLVKSNLANLNGVKYLQYTYSQLQEKLYENDLRFLISK